MVQGRRRDRTRRKEVRGEDVAVVIIRVVVAAAASLVILEELQ